MENMEVSTVLATQYPALSNAKAEPSVEDELLAEEMEALGDIRLKFPKIKLGASGNGKLDVPDAGQPDETHQVKEIECLLVMAQTSRAKWGEDGALVPECASSNGKTSFDGKLCQACKKCKFTKDSEGNLVRPECKESRNIFVLTKEHNIPLQFMIPPSGISEYDKFARELLSSGKSQLGTIIRISVDIAVNKANQKYNKAKFSTIGRADQETIAKLMELRKQIVNTIATMTITEMAEDDNEVLTPVEDDGTMPF